jgi:hypothetical protein
MGDFTYAPCSSAGGTLFHMKPQEKALQAAMAEEVRSKLGRMNKSQAWLGRHAHVSPSAWRRYFTAIDRSIPLAVVERIADVLGMTGGELITIAEGEALRYEPLFMPGLSDDERADLLRASERNGPADPPAKPVPENANLQTGT